MARLYLFHIKFYFTHTTIWTHPSIRHIAPQRTGRYTLVRRAQYFVVDPATDLAFIALHKRTHFTQYVAAVHARIQGDVYPDKADKAAFPIFQLALTLQSSKDENPV